MKEVIVKLNSDHIKVKGGEYVQDLVRCGECIHFDDGWCNTLDVGIDADDFCNYGEVRDE